MVNINLFDENEEEEQDQTPDQDSGMGDDDLGEWDDADSDLSLGDEEDAFGDDIGFGDEDESESLETSDLDSDSLLEDDEAIPDFDEPEDEIADEDYAFGEVKKKQTSPVFLILLLVVVGLAAVDYFDIFDLGYIGPKKKTPPRRKPTPVTTTAKPGQQVPGQTPPKTSDSVNTQTTPVTTPTNQPATTSPNQPATTPGTSTTPPVTQPVTTPQSTPPVQPVAGAVNSITAGVSSAKSVFNTLASRGQLGVVIIETKYFMVQFVSEQSGQSKAIGNEIASLLKATEFNISPEDPHRTGGKMYYWGVVSGSLPYTLSERSATPGAVTNLDALIARIKSLAQSNTLTSRDVQKFPRSFQGTQQRHPGKIVIEGEKTNIIAFMDALPSIPGAWGLTRVMLTPQKQSDFSASSVKLDLEFWILEQ